MNRTIEIFSTSPQSSDHPQGYFERVRDVSRWSEECGFKGILVYADNRLADPWMVSQVIAASTCNLSPLVAVQPAYMHPYTAANMVASIGLMYNRKMYLNMVAGGFKNDLIALNDHTPHDRRYERLVEYTSIITGLLKGEKPVTFKGEFYQVNNLGLKPELDQRLLPGIFVSGSSYAGLNASRALGATAIQYPHPPDKYSDNLDDDTLDFGIRVGIIAREDAETAWQIGYERFPADRAGQIAHKFAMKTSDSVWHKTLTDLSSALNGSTTPYWLHPFENYKTFCPYLVGSYDQVALELSRYMEIGYRTFILDIPASKEELIHTKYAFDKASELEAV
jgi:alkanesulfonate monooxygenase